MGIWNTIGKAGMGLLNGVTGGLASAGIGMITAGANDKRQLEQQDKLSKMQIGYNKEMTDYQNQKQLEMWHATNYGAQKEEMKKAGLSPGLMYGLGGGGGATTGGGAASNSGGGNAPSGGMEIMNMLQMRNMEAQRKLLEAQTENVKTDTIKKGGVDTANIEAQTENTRRETENKILEGIVKKFAGYEARDVYNYKSPGNIRGIEAAAWENEQAAKSAIADNIYQFYASGDLMNKTNAELEQLLLRNAKTKEETRNIIKGMDLLEEKTKGEQLSNILKEVETEWAKGTGLKSTTASGLISKILSLLMRK